MLQYIVILLDDTSTSFCHYKSRSNVKRLMPLETLKQGIMFAMKHNLSTQFIFPNYELPKEYYNMIDSIEHCNVKPIESCDKADVIVINSIDQITSQESFKKGVPYILRLNREQFFANSTVIAEFLSKISRLNVVITDLDHFNDAEINQYKSALETIRKTIIDLIVKGFTIQLNLLTDRISLTQMANCNAGVTHITLAPNGKFYACPAFYYSNEIDGSEISQSDVCKKGYNIGSVYTGIEIKDAKLYELEYSPICKICDSYQCRRCIWFNRKKTLELNIPSHEQCVVSHIERNVSRNLLQNLKSIDGFVPEWNIPEINYLDPFDKIKN